MVFDEPLTVGRKLSGDERAVCREELRRRMRRADLRAEKLAGLIA